MNATRANSAADSFAKAVQHAAAAAAAENASTHSRSDESSEQSTSVVAKVLYANDDDHKIFSVEVNGQVFTPARDQAEERRARRMDQIGAELVDLAGAQAPRVEALLGELDQLWATRALERAEHILRVVGATLEHNALMSADHAYLRDLWHQLYARLASDDEWDLVGGPSQLLRPRPGEDVNQFFARGTGW